MLEVIFYLILLSRVEVFFIFLKQKNDVKETE